MCSVAYTLNIAGATFEMPDYCLLVVNSRRGRDLGPPRPDTFRRAVQLQGRATTRGDRRRGGGGRCEHITYTVIGMFFEKQVT